MVLLNYISFFLLLFLPSSNVFAQSTTSSYTAYQSSFPFVTSCPSRQYYDIALLQCSNCPTNAVQSSNDQTQCDCASNLYYYGVNQGGGSLLCSLCNNSDTRSTDGFGCVFNSGACNTSLSTIVPSESNLDGTLYPISPSTIPSSSSDQPRYGSVQCTTCQAGTWADPSDQRCTPCASVTPSAATPTGTIICCNLTSADLKDGICLTNIKSVVGTLPTFNYNNVYSSPTISSFIQNHLDASVYLCRMNLNSITAQSSTRTLLSNATACQVLANIIAMQFYYPATGYAYQVYQSYIWQPSQIWTASSPRTSIPFLAYPSTYYSEITNSSYNWIPASFSQNDIIRLKLAKYSPLGDYLGLFDAVDAYSQLCGGGYTNGRPAFTFGTQYQSSCTIRADALWNSRLYETAFFDPYIVYTKSGSDYMLPTPIVITNYITDTGATPNQNADESQWVYHRRFFLLDRISGNTTSGDLKSIHYAQSITVLNTLTSGTNYIQPPVIVIEYGELSLSDIGKGTIVEVTFQTQYRMDLSAPIRAIWIAVGVISALGIILAFIQTSIWHTRAGKEIVDLATIGKFLLFIVNIIGTIFFIVMAGVSLWWLIFFKRQDAVYLVIPSDIQQASFTALVVIAFILKTIDILHLIIHQSRIDIFFIDWEKPKTGNPNTVSAWRSCFVANEYSEIQTFRRINLVFQLMFVLFLLKVINLEYVATAQPSVSLFPSSADYIPGYNGILRVGIAFSMWLATALIQYLVYVIFYQRFVEDKVINFIDLCSVSNISVFILMENHYGYYIHGQSPHGTTDLNMKEMLLNLERETNKTIGGRGLGPKSDDQLFIIRVDKVFRSQYELLLRNYQHRLLTHLTKKNEEHESEILLLSYRNLNEFLTAFISQTIPSYTYIIRPRRLLEKILNCEFRARSAAADLKGETESEFFIDADRNFTKTLFSGYENSLFVWNMATFLFIDYFAFNYILAAIITYLLNIIAESIRNSLGQKNLSKKTLIPKNFI